MSTAGAADLAPRIENLFHDWEPECERYADFEVVAREDRLLWTRRHPFPWGSSVRWIRWSEETAERGIGETLAFFRERNRRFVWIVGPLSTPSNLGSRLGRCGFTVESRSRLLSASLLLRQLQANQNVRIVEVTDEAGARESLRLSFRRLSEGSYGSTGDFEQLLAERLTYLRCPTRRGGWAVAYLNDAPVGTGGWRDSSDGRWVYLWGGRTHEDFRRRGIYSALVAYRGERARTRGRERAAIVANMETSAPILLRRGFRDHGALRTYLSPES